MKTIPLTQGYSAIVDDEDYECVSQYIWRAHPFKRIDGTVRIYAARNVIRSCGKRTTERLHRYLLHPLPKIQVDHINGNGLDNRRSNLRVCTAAENGQNRRPPSGGTSVYKGVSWHKTEGGKWQAHISVNGKNKYLGLFSLEISAAKEYDAAAIKHFGEFARLNFPDSFSHE